MKYLSLITTCTLLFSLEQTLAVIEFPWMYYLPYGKTVTLKPLFQNETEKILIKTCKWITPNNVEIIPDVYMIDKSRYSIVKSKCELTINNIQKDTNGVYHCNINDKYISKAMLNVHGAPKASLLEEFTPNLIAGFSTFGGIIVFFIFACTVHKFRYIDDSNKQMKKFPENVPENYTIPNELTENCHVNSSFNGDDIEKHHKSSIKEDGVELEIVNKQTRF